MTTGLTLVKKDLGKLDAVIAIYQQELIEANSIIKLSGKPIDIANAEHSGWMNYYHEKEVEVKFIKEYVQTKLNEVHGELWRKYTEKSDRQLLAKDKEEYIKHNAEFLNIYEQFLKIEELYEQFTRVRDSFTARGYALNNLTRLVIATNNDWIIP